MLALGLASLEITLKQAPERGWTSGLVLGLLGLSGLSALGFIRRSLGGAHPVVDLRAFGDRNFAVGCILSFVLGIGLFGSVYLMPVFLAFVRGQNALQIGTVMLVTGLAQLVMAPVAVALERRVDARLLTAAGFGLFALGLGQSAFQTPQTDFAGMFWPQITRGLAIMFCLLPPTRLALGRLAPDKVPDASGLFNLMRNLGGAIGLALIDTVIYSRAAGHGATLISRLQTGDLAAARFIGLPVQAMGQGALTPALQAQLAPLVDKAALTLAINDAWAMIAILTVAALACVPFVRRSPVT
jgi:DHA2 family multidrug resistance protein